MYWKISVFFLMESGDSIELASYLNSEKQAVTLWLCLGRARKESQLYLVIYDDQYRCLNAKQISVESFNLLLIDGVSSLLN
ncbi:hypothetical protein [uncultured Vibrio sp.]|uniref:hypothetical protein n=1 Tax=uncultured Vibrio sp. TaxID=114054 RepID=UPI0026293BBA|nr:hypothetical protein [uncultured Vibrio sp.]